MCSETHHFSPIPRMSGTSDDKPQEIARAEESADLVTKPETASSRSQQPMAEADSKEIVSVEESAADLITKSETTSSRSQLPMTEADPRAVERKEVDREGKDQGKALEGAGNDEEDEEKKEEEKEEERNVVVVSTSLVEDDDDGFRTPTSSDHKIQPITQCPPAPKKARPQPSKRKASQLSPRRGLHFDDSSEVESIFRPASSQEDSVEEDKQENKRARREDGED